MNCALKNRVYAILLVFFVCLQSLTAYCREGKTPNSKNGTIIKPDLKDQFQWYEHSKLSWDDFRGSVNAATDEAAAATHCGIGFRTNTNLHGSNPEIIVYNIFYATKSWVRSDAKIPSILDHEQGHFDLCEIYTRKLKNQMSKFDFNSPDIMQALMSIYSEVSNEYEARQKAYEEETIHGTNTSQQKRWRQMINNELM